MDENKEHNMKDFVTRVADWNTAAGRSDDYFNARATSLHIGLQLEELGEKIDAIANNEGGHAYHPLILLADYLRNASAEFKCGTFDDAVEHTDRIDLLDADCDLMVVTVGSMMSQGADLNGALNEVCTSNESKSVRCPECLGHGKEFEESRGFVGCEKCNGRGWILQKDENGKIKKGSDYVAPVLDGYVFGGAK